MFIPDPETYDWNLLDEVYRQKLDKRKYVSPSHDTKETPAENPEPASLGSPDLPAVEASTSSSIDNSKSKAAIYADDKDVELDEEDSENDDAEIPEGSLFDYNIAGVLTKDEVAKLDLAHWKLLVRNALIDLEVSSCGISATICLLRLGTGSERVGRMATR